MTVFNEKQSLSDEMIQNFDEINFNESKISDLKKHIKNRIDTISNDIFNGKISVFDSATYMAELTNYSMKFIAIEFATSLGVNVSELPFAIFLFGSFVRNLMLPNSDLDIGLVFDKSCPNNVKLLLNRVISSLPFADEVDIAHWDSINSMLKENCTSLMEQNKAIEARFVTGNDTIAKQHTVLIRESDSRVEKEKRFITEYLMFRKFDYKNRSSEQGMNIKYDFGASKDIAFLDWYYQINSSEKETSTNTSTAIRCINLLVKKGIISIEELKKIELSLELVLLVKFTLWEISTKTKDQSLLYLNDSSLNVCFEKISTLLKDKGINNVDEFTFAYYQAKGKLHHIVTKLFYDISSSNNEIIDLWKIAENKITLDDEVIRILVNPTWNELVPFAVQSTSAEILDYIVNSFSDKPGFEYILRIISQNKYIAEKTKQRLLTSRLDDRFKTKLLES